MQLSGVETSVVMATNGGFGGNALNQEMANAVKMLSSEPTMRDADTRNVAAAINELMPDSQSVALSAQRDTQVRAQSTPSSGQSNIDRGF